MEVDKNCCTYCSLTCSNCYKMTYTDKIDCDKCDKQLCMNCIKHISKIGNIKVCKNLCQVCFEDFCEIPCCGIFIDLKTSTKCYKCNKLVNIASHIESHFT